MLYVCFFAVLKAFLGTDYFEKSVLLSSCVHTQSVSYAAWWGQSQGHILDGGCQKTSYE